MSYEEEDTCITSTPSFFAVFSFGMSEDVR
jgi:hypothetical protein